MLKCPRCKKETLEVIQRRWGLDFINGRREIPTASSRVACTNCTHSYRTTSPKVDALPDRKPVIRLRDPEEVRRTYTPNEDA